MNINVDLCSLFVSFYKKKKEAGITFIPDTKVAKYVMIRTYNAFLKEGILTPIEFLSGEEKIKLTTECREMKNVSYSNESLITSCKILHLIKFINNNT